MIFYLVTEAHRYTINKYLEGWGTQLIPHIKPISYEQISKQRKLLPGTYIFSDIERLNPEQADIAARIWKQLSNVEGVRLLNHPTRSMRRYELLRTLYEQGLNQFNVYRLTENRIPEKIPVFLRGENDHNGSQSVLLKTVQELDNIINELFEKGETREGKIITEFCDTSDEKGIFRKYTAYLIGERIIPRSVFFGHNWMLKSKTSLPSDEEMLREEQKYQETNPHEAQLREIFRLARIEYGRIDYSLLNGAIQTWEINTNPHGLFTPEMDKDKEISGLPLTEYFSKQFELAFKAIDSKTSQRARIPTLVNSQVPELTPRKRLSRYRKQLPELMFKSFLPYQDQLISVNVAKRLLTHLWVTPSGSPGKRYLQAWALLACLKILELDAAIVSTCKKILGIGSTIASFKPGVKAAKSGAKAVKTDTIGEF
jgi:hypothetical protein